MNNLSKKYIVYGLMLTLFLGIGFSLAYFSSDLVGNGKDVTVQAGRLSVIFTDTTEIAVNQIRPDWSTSKTFTVENKTNDLFNYNITIKDLVNTLETEGYLQYKITSTDGGYSMTDYVPIPRSSSPTKALLVSDIDIEAGALHTYTIEFRYVNDPDVDQSGDMGKNFSGSLSIEEGTVKAGTLTGKILSDHKTRPGARPNLNSDVFTEENTGTLYTASGNQTEDGKTVYYFAGNALDNWVKFAGIYWRIIRINEEGSVRLLYVGPDKNTEAGYIGESAYNTVANDPNYVGYMYGDSGSLENNRKNITDSTIKGVIDTWYDDTIELNYDGYVSKTAIYCNDRANEGYSTSAAFNYAARHRLVDAKAPSYKCGNDANGNLYSGINGADVADKFTVSALTGNGKLTNPVALVTGDELAYAGGKFQANGIAYYYHNAAGGSVTGSAWWWTMSPSDWSSGFPTVLFVSGSDDPGTFGRGRAERAYGVRPVLSLKSCVKWKSGDGTSDNPYEVDIDSTCSEQNEKTKYNVEMNITGGTIKPTNVMVAEGDSRKFTITPSEGYILSEPTVNCSGGASYSLEGNILTISGVNSNQVCNVTLKQEIKVTLVVNNGTGSTTKTLDTVGGSLTFTDVAPNDGYLFNSGNMSCTGGATIVLNGTTVTVSNINSTQTCTVPAKSIPLLKDQILADHPTRPGARPNLNSDVFTDSNTKTLYTASGNLTEDGETVYYFSGNAQDNWVKFAGIYWRIIRINEDESVRLLYVGPDKNTEAGYIGTSVYNSTANNPMYVGYMYGSTGSLANNRKNTTNSTIKGVIDTWYDNTIEPSYNGYVSKTAIYCNDRANEGYSTSATFYYAASKRLVDANEPSYKCGNDANGNLYNGTNGANELDKFTGSTSIGNGKLTNPVTLMTADEAVFAGGKFDTNAPAYYYYNAAGGSVVKSNYWWTMSPRYWNGSASTMFIVHGSSFPGRLKDSDIRSTSAVVRPVLSLKSCVKWKSGDGTSDNPYEATIDSVCESKDEVSKYNLTINVTGGTVKPTNVIISEIETKSFTVTANEGYVLDNPTISCSGGATASMSGGELTIGDVKSNQTCTVTLKQNPSLKDQILADHPTRPGSRPGLNVKLTPYQDANTKTLYTASGNQTEGGKTVYYFSGNATDNWVKFADMYWRIIRINEDGSVRLLYVGADKNTEAGYISKSTFNATVNKPKYVGYMYGTNEGSVSDDRVNNVDSTVKKVVDTWYDNTIESSYNGYVSKTAIYCNDRANEGYTISYVFNFAPSVRLLSNQAPSYKCGNNASGSLYTGTDGASSADKFTASTSTGNGKLTNPVALMTADEVVYAGGTNGSNAKTYYHYNAKGTDVTGNTVWLTMTPEHWNRSQAVFIMIGGSADPGRLYQSTVDATGGVRPVLSLKSCVKWKSGNGTSDSPYEVATVDNTCSSAEN